MMDLDKIWYKSRPTQGALTHLSHLDQIGNDREMELGLFHRAEGVLQMGFQK